MPDVTKLGSRYRTVRSFVGRIPIAFGETRTLELPRSFLYKSIYLRINGAVNSTVTAASVPGESPLQLISKAEIIADGRKLIVANAGRDLYRLAHVFRGKEPERDQPATGVVNPNNFRALIPIDFEAARMAVPVDSFFDPRPFEKVELRLTYGAVTDILTGGTHALLANAFVDVMLFQTVEGAEHVFANRLHLFDEFTFSAASSAFTINVPRSGLLAGILLRVEDGSPLVPSNGPLNSVSLKSDNNFLHVDTVRGDILQAANVSDYQLDQAIVADSVAGAGLTGQMPTGYYFVDLTEDGMITSTLNTFDLNVLQLVLDLNAPAGANGRIRASYLFYEPIAAR